MTRLGGWTFGFVLANQIALFVVTILAGSVAGPDPVSSYTYAYAFFQLPYGIVAVTVMSVVTPDLAEQWSTGHQAAFLSRMTGGLRAVLALIIPSAVGMLLLAKPAVALLLGIGHSTPAETATTGAALAMFALGLPGFCTYLYLVRVLQSMQRTRVAFYLYLVENALNIVLALLLVHPLGVRGLALSLSIAYTVAALLALAVFHQWFGAWPSARRGRRWSGSRSPPCPWASWCSWCPTSRGRPPSRPPGPGRRLRGGRRADFRRRRDLAGPAPRLAPASPSVRRAGGPRSYHDGPGPTGTSDPPSRRPRRAVRPLGPPGATRRVASSRKCGAAHPRRCRRAPTTLPRLACALPGPPAPRGRLPACPASTSSPTVPAT